MYARMRSPTGKLLHKAERMYTTFFWPLSLSSFFYYIKELKASASARTALEKRAHIFVYI